MKMLKALLLSIALALCKAEYEILLEETDELTSSTGNQFGNNKIQAFRGRCLLILNTNGNLFVQRFDLNNGSIFPKYEGIPWSTGGFEGPDKYSAALNPETGMLEIKAGGNPVYKTVRIADPDEDYGYTSIAKGPYRLVMTENCDLAILGTIDNGKEDVSIWRNIRSTLENTDVMQRGDILRGWYELWNYDRKDKNNKDYSVSIPMQITLQNDCNLVERVGSDKVDSYLGNDIVWSSDRRLGTNEDCYLYVDRDSIGLYRGNFDETEREVGYPERKGRYWFKEKKAYQRVWLNGDDGFDVWS